MPILAREGRVGEGGLGRVRFIAGTTRAFSGPISPARALLSWPDGTPGLLRSGRLAREGGCMIKRTCGFLTGLAVLAACVVALTYAHAGDDGAKHDPADMQPVRMIADPYPGVQWNCRRSGQRLGGLERSQPQEPAEL